MPFKRAMLHQRCGVSSVWAMPSCSVLSSSSWGACFSWPLPCFSWMTERRLKNSKWLRQCWNNSLLFNSLLGHLLLKKSRPARNVFIWIRILRTPPQLLKTSRKFGFYSACHADNKRFDSSSGHNSLVLQGFDAGQGQAAQHSNNDQPLRLRKKTSETTKSN